MKGTHPQIRVSFEEKQSKYVISQFQTRRSLDIVFDHPGLDLPIHSYPRDTCRKSTGSRPCDSTRSFSCML